MKKRILAVILMSICLVTGFFWKEVKVNAEESGENLDFSYLTTDNTLVGFADVEIQGIYLSDGHSFISEISETKVGVGGLTNAEYRCTVSVTSILERKTSTGWARVDSWTQTNENAFSAAVNRAVMVATNNYYRVRSIHYASSDTSSSWTGALPM